MLSQRNLVLFCSLIIYNIFIKVVVNLKVYFELNHLQYLYQPFVVTCVSSRPYFYVFFGNAALQNCVIAISKFGT